MERPLMWRPWLSGVIDCLVMSLFLAMSVGLTLILWH